jgi:hypothetical protein
MSDSSDRYKISVTPDNYLTINMLAIKVIDNRKNGQQIFY